MPLLLLTLLMLLLLMLMLLMLLPLTLTLTIRQFTKKKTGHPGRRGVPVRAVVRDEFVDQAVGKYRAFPKSDTHCCTEAGDCSDRLP